jgi:phosphatidylglycerophosphate synthase
MIAVIDCPTPSPGSATRLGNFTLLEYLVRDRIDAGATRVVVRGDNLPSLPVLSVPVEILPPGAALPEGAAVTPGDELLGVKVVDQASLRRAKRALLQSCRRPYDGLMDRILVRSISLQITNLLWRAPIHPCHVTGVSILSGLTGAFCATQGHFAFAGLFLFLQILLDSVDGELARLRFQKSRLGMNLDNYGDEIVDNSFIAAVGIGLGGTWAVIGVAAASLRLLATACLYGAFYRAGRDPDPLAFHPWFDKDTSTSYYSKLTLPVLFRAFLRRDFFSTVWSLLCVVGLGWIVVLYGSTLAVGYATIMFLHFVVKRKGLESCR